MKIKLRFIRQSRVLLLSLFVANFNMQFFVKGKKKLVRTKIIESFELI